jgi:hypothetical protein
MMPGLRTQKSFLHSFVNKIEVDESEAKIIYSWPPDNPDTETIGVLPIVQYRPPYRARTSLSIFTALAANDILNPINLGFYKFVTLESMLI